MKKTFLILAASLVASLASSAYAGSTADTKTTSTITNYDNRVKPALKVRLVGNPVNDRRARFKKFAKAHPNEARRIILRHNLMK